MHMFRLQKVRIKAHQIFTHKQFLLLFHIFCLVDSKGEKCIRSEFTSDIPVNIIVPLPFFTCKSLQEVCTTNSHTVQKQFLLLNGNLPGIQNIGKRGIVKSRAMT